jgi:hypothetical protein
VLLGSLPGERTLSRESKGTPRGEWLSASASLGTTSASHTEPATEMLDQGVPPENVIGVLGRVSEKMLDAYKHTRLRAKQEALGMARAHIIAFPGQRSVQR